MMENGIKDGYIGYTMLIANIILLIIFIILLIKYRKRAIVKLQ